MKNRNYISVFYYFFIYYIAATIANTASVEVLSRLESIPLWMGIPLPLERISRADISDIARL